jgi:hypothetical protein
MDGMHGTKLVGQFMAFSQDPEGIIAMDFRSLEEARTHIGKLKSPPCTHWQLMGMCDDKLCLLYEEKDGIVMFNLFKE